MYMLTQKQIDFLNKYTAGTWEVNPSTGLVDIKGSFIYSGHKTSVKYPLRGLRFGEVTDDFIFEASPSVLDDLDGFPQRVGRDFICSRCYARSLKGGPIEVGRDYFCSFNNLINFEYAPERINGNFVARFNNKLETLDGLPKWIGGDLNLDDGYPWSTKIDIRNIKILFLSDVRGKRILDRDYGNLVRSIGRLNVQGINITSLLEIMKKRGLISIPIKGL